MYYLKPFVSWKAAVAWVLSSWLLIAEALVGNPFLPEGRGLALVIILFLTDAFLAIIIAFNVGTFRIARLKSCLGKIMVWGILLMISKQLGKPIEVAWVDPALNIFSQYIIVQLVFIDLVSILKHIISASRVFNFNAPGLDALILLIERWHDTSMPQNVLPIPIGKLEENGHK